MKEDKSGYSLNDNNEIVGVFNDKLTAVKNCDRVLIGRKIGAGKDSAIDVAAELTIEEMNQF